MTGAGSEFSSPISEKSQDLESGFDDLHDHQELHRSGHHRNGVSNHSEHNHSSQNSNNTKENVSWLHRYLHRPCLVVAEGIKWLPVAFITAVISWSYYAFVVVVCIQTVESLAEKIIFIIFFHIILFMFLWSYARTIFAPRCETPQKWKLSPAMVERLGKAQTEEEWKNLLELYVVEMEVSVMQRSVQGAIR